jgi:hypothetical protein
LVCLVLAPLPASAQVLYATQACGSCDPYPDGLYTLNPADGTPSLIGNMGESVTGLDVHPLTGALYGTTTPNSANGSSLIMINTSDASVTVVGGHGLDAAITDLTFAPDGTLFGWLEPGRDQVVTIDTTTGAATFISNYGGLSTCCAAFDLGPDGFFYYFGTGTGMALGTSIVQMQVVDGQPLGEWPLNLNGDRFLGGSFDGSGVLYGLQGLDNVNRELATVDLATGNVSVAGATTDYLSGLAWSTTPEIVWPAPIVTPVPVLSRAGIVVLAVLLAGIGVLLVRRLYHG